MRRRRSSSNMEEDILELAREAFAKFDKNNSGNIDQKVRAGHFR